MKLDQMMEKRRLPGELRRRLRKVEGCGARYSAPFSHCSARILTLWLSWPVRTSASSMLGLATAPLTARSCFGELASRGCRNVANRVSLPDMLIQLAILYLHPAQRISGQPSAGGSSVGSLCGSGRLRAARCLSERRIEIGIDTIALQAYLRQRALESAVVLRL